MYYASGANRQSAGADWAPDGTLVYGAGVNLAVWRPADETGVAALLAGHTGTVKAVQAVAADGATTYFASSGDDGALKLWAVSRAGSRCVQTVDGAHAAAVNCIAAERRPLPSTSSTTTSTPTLFATGGADYAIKLWSLQRADTDTPRIALLQTITTTPHYFPLCLALVRVRDGAWLLAAAGTSNRIQLFAGPSPDAFALAATLSGHEGWVRSLDFAWEDAAADAAASDILLASASQDKYVRLWRVHKGASVPALSASAAAAAALLGEDAPALSSTASPSNKAHRLRVADDDYSVTFEALLFGHEDWIYSAKWERSSTSGAAKARLLTTSADNSLAVWEADAGSGIWVTTARLGELSKEKGATTATGSVGGFWVGLWGATANGSEVVVLCRTGSWRRWVWAADAGSASTDGRWVQAVGVAGHVAPVTGIAWSRDGSYLLSTSTDQTTRLHAEWSASTSTSTSRSWHEMARPQIHGYDLNCIDALGPTQFVSGADEKLLRVFHEPKSVARLLADLGVTGAPSSADMDVLPDAANMPVLGLSNKAVDDDNAAAAETQTETLPAHPPYEDTLARSTLWPETEKLYGHGYEISCLAVSHDGALVASACRASSLNHAVVRLFATQTWTEVRPPLAAHALTVTRLRFSDDDALLLSVGRDRQWAVFARAADAGHAYAVDETNTKAHARMILDCAWAPRVDGRRVFATAGRDKSVKVWARADTDAATFALATTIPQDHAVTAVDFLWRTAPAADGPRLVLAMGTEAGRLSVATLDAATLAVSTLRAMDDGLCLPKAVLQLAWRPRVTGRAETDMDTADLAVAGDDSSLRVYRVDL